MNQDDILKLARKCAISFNENGLAVVNKTEFTRFAGLVTQHERESIASPLTQELINEVLDALQIGYRYAMHHLVELKHYKHQGQTEVMGRLDKIRATIAKLESIKEPK